MSFEIKTISTKCNRAQLTSEVFQRSVKEPRTATMVADSILEHAYLRNSVRFPPSSSATLRSSLPAPFPSLFLSLFFCLVFLVNPLYLSKSNSSDLSGFSIKCLRMCHLSVNCTFLFPEFLVMVTTYTYDCVSCVGCFVMCVCMCLYVCTYMYARVCMRCTSL